MDGTGVRNRFLTPFPFHLMLDEERPFVTVKARRTKNKLVAKQYVKHELAEELRHHVAHKTASAAVFALPKDYNMAKMLRADLAEARRLWLAEAKGDPDLHAKRTNSDFLADINDAGETLDFHALRHTCGSWLILAGETINVVQQVLRHSSVVLTVDTYGHLKPGATADAIQRFQDVRSTQFLAATGNEGNADCRTTTENDVRNDGCRVRGVASVIESAAETEISEKADKKAAARVVLQLDAAASGNRPGGI